MLCIIYLLSFVDGICSNLKDESSHRDYFQSHLFTYWIVSKSIYMIPCTLDLSTELMSVHTLT